MKHREESWTHDAQQSTEVHVMNEYAGIFLYLTLPLSSPYIIYCEGEDTVWFENICKLFFFLHYVIDNFYCYPTGGEW